MGYFKIDMLETIDTNLQIKAHLTEKISKDNSLLWFKRVWGLAQPKNGQVHKSEKAKLDSSPTNKSPLFRKCLKKEQIPAR